MVHVFKKHIINEQGDFKIAYYHNNKFQKFVDKDKPMYVEWCMSNTVEIIPYTPIADESENNISKLKKRAINKSLNKQRKAYSDRLWEESIEYSNHQTAINEINNMNKGQLKGYLNDN